MTATVIERDEAAWVTEDRYRYMRVVEVAGRVVRIRITRGAAPVPSRAVAEVLADTAWTHLAYDSPDNWIATTPPPSSTVHVSNELGAVAERLIQRAAEILAPTTTTVLSSYVRNAVAALLATTYGYNGELRVTPEDIEWATNHGGTLHIIEHDDGSVTFTKEHRDECPFIATAGTRDCDDECHFVHPADTTPAMIADRAPGGSTMDTTVLGQGVLGWPAEERHSDRYGLIHLNVIPDTAHFTPLPFDTALAGAHGRLVAVVLDTRPSPHIGDMARAVGPAIPAVGEEITLGTGTLFVAPWRWGFSLVGVKPDEDRSHDWMDPAALYRCHHQTVRLELRPDGISPSGTRRHGSSYLDSAGLSLPQLAERLMADLVTRAADPDSGMPVHARYSAAVNPVRRTIVLAVFGLSDEEIYDHPDAPAGTVITHHAQPLIDAHNWTTPGVPDDFRFTTTIVAFDHAGQRRLIDRGRGPGTVCVITTDRDGWWHA